MSETEPTETLLRRRDVGPIVIRLSAGLLALGVFFYWMYSEAAYSRLIAPGAMATLADYVERFGTPKYVQETPANGQVYYHLVGPLPGRASLAMPSSPPIYIFDQTGRYSDWCRDTGQDRAYWLLYPRQENSTVLFAELCARLGLDPKTARPLPPGERAETTPTPQVPAPHAIPSRAGGSEGATN